MSRIKEHYHEQICEGLRKAQLQIEKENKELEKKAEEQSFINVFEKTGTYPI